MNRWLFKSSFLEYYKHPNLVRRTKVKTEKNARSPQVSSFFSLGDGDIVIWYDYVQGLVIGIFKVVSGVGDLLDDTYCEDSDKYDVEPYKMMVPENTFFNLRSFFSEHSDLKKYLREASGGKTWISVNEDDFKLIEDSFFNSRYHKEIKETKGNRGPTGWRINPDLLAGLLDYYNSRAVSFASLLVASVFGLITLSAIIQTVFGTLNPTTVFDYFSIGISIGLYLLFAGAGWYMLKCYSYYTAMADKIKNEGIQKPYFSDLSKISIWDKNRSRYSTLVEILDRAEKDHGHSRLKSAVRDPDFRKIMFGLAFTFLAVFIYWNLAVQLVLYLLPSLTYFVLLTIFTVVPVRLNFASTLFLALPVIYFAIISLIALRIKLRSKINAK